MAATRAWPRRWPIPAGIVEEVTQSGLRGRGGAGFPTGIKWKTVADAKADRKYIVCNADEGDSGTFADRMIMEGDPFVPDRGHDDRRLSPSARPKATSISAPNIRTPIAAMNAALDVARGAAACSARASPARHSPSISKCASAPAPMSAARKRRCSKASKASAALCAPSRRCRRTRACSASRPSSTTCCRSRPCRSSWTRARRSTKTSAWAARAAPCRSSSPATSITAACSRRRSASRSANSSTISAAARLHRPAGAGGAGRRPARRLFPAGAVRHAVRLRGLRRKETA